MHGNMRHDQHFAHIGTTDANVGQRSAEAVFAVALDKRGSTSSENSADRLGWVFWVSGFTRTSVGPPV